MSNHQAAQSARNVALGAATGAVAGGGLHGAALGAAKAAANTRTGRRLIALATVLALFAVTAVGMGIGATLSAAGADSFQANVQSESTKQAQGATLNSGGDLDEDVIRTFTRAVGSSGVAWQVLASLATQPASMAAGGLPPGATWSGVLPEDLASLPPGNPAVEEGLQPNTLAGYRAGVQEFPEVKSWGGVGYRAANSKSDHPSGRAIDAMTNDGRAYDSPEAKALGNRISDFYIQNASKLGVRYVIFYDRIWNVETGRWDPYTHPSKATDPTSAHRDHVHVSFLGASRTSGGALLSMSMGVGGLGAMSPLALTVEPEDEGEPDVMADPGWGPFRLDPEDGRYTQEQAEDLEWAAGFVADELAARVQHGDMSTGTKWCSTTYVRVIDTGSDACTSDATAGGAGETANAEGATSALQGAVKVRESYEAAMTELPVMNIENDASDIYMRALTWYLGWEYVSAGSYGGGQCVLTPTDGEGAGVPATDLTTTRTDGKVALITVDQLNTASQIVAAANAIEGMTEQGLVLVLMTALQESTLVNLEGGDRDSQGLYQQRPSMGWGTIEQVRDIPFATRSFFGVNPEVANSGLFDVAGWESMRPTVAIQKVQRSGFPEHYAKWETTAKAILQVVGGYTCTAPAGAGEVTAEGWTMPITGTVRATSEFGPRWGRLHAGIDLVSDTKVIVAAADGVVTHTGPWIGNGGQTVYIDHGGGVHTEYLHLVVGSIKVRVGDRVTAGQPIATMGNTGVSYGAHLHFGVMTGLFKAPTHGGWRQSAYVNPRTFLSGVGVRMP